MSKRAIIFIASLVILISGCEYFRVMSYDELVQFKSGEDKPTEFVFPENTVFVAPHGRANAAGTKEDPFLSINEAISSAETMMNASGGSSGFVAVHADVFMPLIPKTNISVFGGFDSSFKYIVGKSSVTVTSGSAVNASAVNFVTIANFTFKTSDTTAGATVAVSGSNITFENTEIYAPNNDAMGIGIEVNSSLIIINRSTVYLGVSGGTGISGGIYLNGSNSGSRISNSKISYIDNQDGEIYGISINGGTMPGIVNNRIILQTEVDDCTGIVITNTNIYADDSMIDRNRISLTGDGGLSAVSITNTTDNPNYLVSNNCIYINKRSASNPLQIEALTISGSGSVLNNTIYVNNNYNCSSSYFVFYEDATDDGYQREISNNIFYYKSDMTTDMTAIKVNYMVNYVSNNDFNYSGTYPGYFRLYHNSFNNDNVYWNNNPSGTQISVINGGRLSMSVFKNLFVNPGFASVDPEFNSSANWMKPSSSSILSGGKSFNSYNHDINGKTRSSPWSIGAFE